MEVNERPTLEHVALRARVSRQTVSNVINSPHLVRADTAARVLDAIEELGYRPHTAARQLRTRRSHVLGLRIEPVRDGINGAVLDRFLHALTERAQARGYRVMIFTAPDDAREIQQYDELLDTADLDAFVLTSTHHGDPRTRWLAERDVPFVTFGRPWDPYDRPTPAEHSWVDIDGAAGTRAATEHLLDLGHRRIAFLGWPEDSDVGTDRRRGWAEALLRAGTEADDLIDWSVGVTDGIVPGTRATEDLLDHVAPTAVVCASDSLAIGALSAARTRSAPLAVVGFDDTPVAAALDLTSVAQPLAEVADRALGLLLRRFDGAHDDPGTPHVLLNPHLVVRGSSTPPPS